MTTLSLLAADRKSIVLSGSQSECIRRARAEGIPLDNIVPRDEALRTVTPRRGTATMTGAGGTFAGQAKLDQQADVNAQLSSIIGGEWAATDPVYAPATRVNALGEANFTREFNQLAEMPTFEELAQPVVRQIASERRTSVTVNAADLRLHADTAGKLFIYKKDVPGRQRPITPAVLDNLMSYWPEVYGGVRSAILTDSGTVGGVPADAKVELFNRMTVDRLRPELQRRSVGAPTKRRASSTKVSGNVSLMLRVQQGQWQAYSVASPRNTSHDLNGGQWLDMLAKALGGMGFRGQLEYNPATTEIEFHVWQMPNHITDLSAGDVFKSGFGGKTSDTGGSYQLWVEVLRNLCLNLIIVATERGAIASATHNSRASKVRADFRDAVGNAAPLVQSVLRTLEGARTTVVPDLNPSDPESVLAILRDIAKERSILNWRSGDAAKRSEGLLLQSFNHEPGNTVASVANAITGLHRVTEINDFDLALATADLVPVLSERYAQPL